MRSKPSFVLWTILAALLAVAPTMLPSAWAKPKYKVLHNFGGEGGGGLWSSVTFDKQGNLYGATSGGGEYGYGTVFKLAPHSSGNWTETVLHSFKQGDPDGSLPNGGLVQGALGNWYGTTSGGGTYGGGVAFELTQHQSAGWEYTVLYRFGTQNDDGGDPTAGLVMDSAGNLYGTAPYGGAYSNGTVFRLTPDSDGWDEGVLYAFGAHNGDGDAPFAGVALDGEGNLYGTTYSGGAHTYGTVYKVQYASGGWQEQVLHNFPSFSKDGHTPGWGNLAMDGSGSLYGTTEGGGCCGGVVYKLTPSSGGHWKETILYEFQGGAGGFEAGAGVVMDKAGVLYGTTIAGGDPNCGCGVVYKLAPGKNGKWTYTVLHTFIGSDGAQPDANLILDDKGNLYGTTATGGLAGAGVVFELTP